MLTARDLTWTRSLLDAPEPAASWAWVATELGIDVGTLRELLAASPYGLRQKLERSPQQDYSLKNCLYTNKVW
jgi:hypothetical protein